MKALSDVRRYDRSIRALSVSAKSKHGVDIEANIAKVETLCHPAHEICDDPRSCQVAKSRDTSQLKRPSTICFSLAVYFACRPNASRHPDNGTVNAQTFVCAILRRRRRFRGFQRCGTVLRKRLDWQ
jgi:hypothetical protein